MLTGEAKKAYQREYMRRYMRNRRKNEGDQKNETHKDAPGSTIPLRPDVKTQSINVTIYRMPDLDADGNIIPEY
jgi:hypothetical protein